MVTVTVVPGVDVFRNSKKAVMETISRTASNMRSAFRMNVFSAVLKELVKCILLAVCWCRIT